MPDISTENTSTQYIESTKLETKDIASYTQDILQSLKNPIADDEKNLKALITNIESDYSHDFAINLVQQLSKAEGQNSHNWISNCDCLARDLLKYIASFHDTRVMSLISYSVGELKTYCEQQITKNKSFYEGVKLNTINKGNIATEINNDKKSILKDSEVITKKISINALNDKQTLESTFAKVKTTIENHKAEIQKDANFAKYKEQNQALLQQVPVEKQDSYLTSRFALEQCASGKDTPAYLQDVKASLGTYSAEEMIAILDAEHGINKIVTTNEPKFENKSFDKVVSLEQQKSITEKGTSFDTLFTAAEIEFYKEGSALRSTLDNLTNTTLFPGARNTNPTEYRSEQADGKVRVPKDQLQTAESFKTWLQTINIDQATKDTLIQQFTTYNTFKNTISSQAQLSPEQKLQVQRVQKFETNMALLASQNRRKDVEQETSKVIAERVFQDVEALIRPNQSSAEKWKIIPQETKGNPPFAIDALGNITIDYELNGAKGKLVVQKDGTVTVTDWFAQKDGYKDLFCQERKLGKIQGLDSYLTKIKSHMPASAADVQKEISSSRSFHKDIAGLVTQESGQIGSVKASVNHTIASQDFFNTVLNQTIMFGKAPTSETSSINTIQQKLHTGMLDSPIVSFQDKGNLAFFFDMFNYCHNASQNDIVQKQNEFTVIADWIKEHKDDPIAQNIALLKPTIGAHKETDGLLHTLSQTPFAQRKDIKIHMEHIYAKAKNEANDKQQTENFLDSYDESLKNAYDN